MFLTCWLVYGLHVATNVVREIYPALSMGDHLSFRVDDYAGLHPDVFEKPGYGWHINANPGASMLAAIPYTLVRPLIDRAVARVNATRSRQIAPPAYDSPWPMAREFYRQAWRRGLDVKFGAATIVIQWLCMAPIAALGVVGMFLLLRRVTRSETQALWLAVLYAFGTPVFFRTGYLNHNMILGHLTFLGFIALWMGSARDRRPYLAAGVAGGSAVLLDYSGVIMLAGLFVYAVAKVWNSRPGAILRCAVLYTAGALVPLSFLFFYQWQSFGSPFLPPQHWMPHVQWSEVGYQGVSWIQPDLLFANMLDYRYGLLTSCPLLLLGAGMLLRGQRKIPQRELIACFAIPIALWLFSSSVSYARLQFNTGVRYMAPAIPFLFLPVAMVLLRLPRRVAWLIAVIAVAQAWSMAMYRDVERGLGILDPVARMFTAGFTLPLLNVLSLMGSQYGDYFAHGVSPLPIFALAAAVLYAIWSLRFDSDTPC